MHSFFNIQKGRKSSIVESNPQQPITTSRSAEPVTTNENISVVPDTEAAKSVEPKGTIIYFSIYYFATVHFVSLNRQVKIKIHKDFKEDSPNFLDNY